jgi:hypothetical protein
MDILWVLVWVGGVPPWSPCSAGFVTVFVKKKK